MRPSPAKNRTSAAALTRRRPRDDAYSLDTLARHLKPFRLHWFSTLGSTNTHAAKMRREGRLLAPSVVLTGNQTAGRGRGSNTWHAMRGIITVTFALPVRELLPPQHVPLVAGLAVRDAVAGLGIDSVGIKWPNDLWINDQKLAGLLCERMDGIDLIGIGLNVNATPGGRVRTPVTCMARHLQRPITVGEVLLSVAKHLHTALTDPRVSLASVLPRLRQVDVLANRSIRVTDFGSTIHGLCKGIDSEGRLLVRRGKSEVALFSGTISLAD